MENAQILKHSLYRNMHTEFKSPSTFKSSIILNLKRKKYPLGHSKFFFLSCVIRISENLPASKVKKQTKEKKIHADILDVCSNQNVSYEW
jgi:hypothetical protein